MYLKRNNLKINLRLIICCFIVSLVTILFYSHDSYLHDMYGRCDSAWFYMCGKAWANGLTPYIDFADSKGPYLWLIYAIGYKISSLDFIGIWWITVIAYTGTFFYTYKILSLYIERYYDRIIGFILMIFLLLNQCTSDEIRAEDFTLVFIAISLYHFAYLVRKDNVSLRDVRKASFIIGLCIGITFLIKYTIAYMLGIFPILIIYSCHKKKIPIISSIIWSIIGCGLAILPFLCYAIYRHCLYAFLYEYIFNTILSVVNVNAGVHVDNSTKLSSLILWYKPLWAYLLLLVWSCCLPLLYKKSYLPIIILLWFITPTLLMGRIYFLKSYNIFFIWGVITYFNMIRNKSNLRLLLFATYIIALIFSVYNMRYSTKAFYDVDNIDNNEVRNVAKFIATNKYGMSVLYWGCADRGETVSGHGMPACKYWSYQTGATEEMDSIQDNCVKNQNADLVFIETNSNQLMDKSFILRQKELSKANYLELKRYMYYGGKRIRLLYAK